MALEVTRAAPVAPKPPVDPQSNANLPRSVRRQIARSEELQQQIQPTSGGDNPPTPAPVDPAAPPTPPSQMPTGGAQPAPTTAPQEPPAPNAPAAAPPVATQPAPSAAPDPSHTPQPEDWEQRFRSLEGRYRSDIQRAADYASGLERQLATQPRAPAPVPDQPLLTPEEIQEYGPDFVNLVERVAQQAQRPLLAKIGTLESELQSTGRRIAVSANDRMLEAMNQRLPGWDQINNHPDFVAWSRLPDIYSGAIRQTLMQDAWNRGDAPRVEAFFRGFLAEQGVSVPSAPVAPAAAPQPQPNGSAAPAQPRVTLESLAAPGRARSAPPTPADKPVYTQAEILQFYTDVATGKFRGTPEQRAAIDADIIAAQHEGRIIVDTRLAARPPAGFTR